MECHTIITIVLVELIVVSGSVLATQGEKTIVPEFYSRNQNGLSEAWILKMQNAVKISEKYYFVASV